MEMEKQHEVVVTQQPQSTPNVVVVQQTTRRNNVPAIGALVFSIVTLVCCPASLFCTIPACICSIVALAGKGSESDKSLYMASYVATAVYWALCVVAGIIVVILALAGVFAASKVTVDVDHYEFYTYHSYNYHT